MKNPFCRPVEGTVIFLPDIIVNIASSGLNLQDVMFVLPPPLKPIQSAIAPNRLLYMGSWAKFIKL